MSKCKICQLFINSEKTAYSVNSVTVHTNCLKCHECQSPLSQKCYMLEQRFFCQTHFFKICGHKCGLCGAFLRENDLLCQGRTESNESEYFHKSCLRCEVCDYRGDGQKTIFVVRTSRSSGERLVICEKDYGNPDSWSSQSPNEDILAEVETADITKSSGFSLEIKEPKTFLSGNGNCSTELKRFKRTKIQNEHANMFNETFKMCQKPDRVLRSKLSRLSGLPEKTIQVWFQNKRSKVKKQKQEVLNANIENQDFNDFRDNDNPKRASHGESQSNNESEK